MDLQGRALFLVGARGSPEIAVVAAGGLALLEHVVGPVALARVVLVLLKAPQEAVILARAWSLLHLLLGLLDLLRRGVTAAKENVLQGSARYMTDCDTSSELGNSS